MNEMTLSALLESGNSNYARNAADYMIVLVEGTTPVPELIVNPVENFDTKLNYYARAYNEDLTLKNNPAIRITSYNFVTRQELVDYYL